MSHANVNDPESVERAYPREAFDEDVGANSRAKAEVMHGVRIASEPAEDGSFELIRAARQVGEMDSESDTVFLFPVLVEELDAMRRTASGYGEAEAGPDALARLERGGAEYRAFISRIVEAARAASFKPAIGRGEERLRGFHGG